jgi:hypothetical protein
MTAALVIGAAVGLVVGGLLVAVVLVLHSE